VALLSEVGMAAVEIIRDANASLLNMTKSLSRMRIVKILLPCEKECGRRESYYVCTRGMSEYKDEYWRHVQSGCEEPVAWIRGTKITAKGYPDRYSRGPGSVARKSLKSKSKSAAASFNLTSVDLKSDQVAP
jgi:hypothetical protein